MEISSSKLKQLVYILCSFYIVIKLEMIHTNSFKHKQMIKMYFTRLYKEKQKTISESRDLGLL